MITVRATDPSDAELLREIRLAALAADPTAFGRTYEEEVEFGDDHWRTRAAGSPRSQTFVAVDGDVIGLVGAFQDAPGEKVELVSMWTAPAARRRGVGGSSWRRCWSGRESVDHPRSSSGSPEGTTPPWRCTGRSASR